jgi:hypothetical protein
MKDNDPLNGVSTFDLVLINKHILGLEPLNSPYKMIAADANNSRSITTFDIVELRKLILGIYTELAQQHVVALCGQKLCVPEPVEPVPDDLPGDEADRNPDVGQVGRGLRGGESGRRERQRRDEQPDDGDDRTAARCCSTCKTAR